ncbi:MAG: hypothetical protein HOA41_06975, partial [Rhodospirillales bacterium]|nr:hypothetical protein [Rhodospirillales bacterium]
MMGITKRRIQGPNDPLLKKVMDQMGITEVPLYKHQSEKRISFRNAIEDMGQHLEGPVGPARLDVRDKEEMSDRIRERAKECGADLVGMCKISPVMIDEGVDCKYTNVIAFGHHESYDEV